MIYRLKNRKILSIITMIILLMTAPFIISGCSSSGDPVETEYAEPSDEPVDWHGMLDFEDPVPAEENPDGLMAHNVYVDPDLSSTSGKYSGFLIDFCADYDATATYWALCNFTMDVSGLAEKHDVTDEGGAYAGLQNTVDGKMGIMSFWEIHYTDDNGEDAILNAERVYPEGGETDRFGGEGEGTNYIGPYPWEKGKWYRMYLNCYEDEDTGHTFVEQWIEDIGSEEWTKVSCFDTGLSDSGFTGEMSQFMENYDEAYCNEVRTCAYRNLYVREYDSGEWTPVKSAVMSIDTGFGNKKGSFAMSADDSTLYGITCGYGEDAAKGEKDVSASYEIMPTEPPAFPE